MPAPLLTPIGAEGVCARSGLFEDVVDRLQALISRARDPETEVLRFPPVMSRRQVEHAGYLSSFPTLLGCVSTLHGSDREVGAAVARYAGGEDWTVALTAADLVLTPAACYPVYPLAASRGPVPAGGLRFDVAAECFRREPSADSTRLQSFRMREYVRIGPREDVVAFRTAWMERASELAEALGLPSRLEQATDPFFGRVGQMRGIVQRQQSLKYELLIPVGPSGEETACMSFNYHQDHFGAAWELRDASGAASHSACAAFGMDRLALALFARHGPDTEGWPDHTRCALAL